ncbi:NTP transferase domain-containing protein, partial [Bacteroidota bacterium]
MEEKIAILILAAGASERFGKPKQLLIYKEHSLISKAVRTALKAKIGPCIVITGSHNKEVEHDLKVYEDKIRLYNNTKWEEGMGSSLRNGIKFINNNIPDVYGVIILLCDQPLINSNFLIEIVRSHFSSRKKIIASGYGGSWGAPVFFHHTLFG